MNKFILIDNSLVDKSGHHYQYAMFCLKAAESLKFEPILASNIKHSDFKKIPWKTFPLFRFGFWSSKEKSTLHKINDFFSLSSKKFKQKKTLNNIKAKYSKLGLYKEIMWILPQFYSTNTIKLKTSIPKSTLLLVGIFFGIPYRFFSYIKNKIKPSIKRITGSIGLYYYYFLKVIAASPVDPITGTRYFEYRQYAFEKDLEKLFKKTPLLKNDHVFIPTTGLTEMLGLMNYCKNNPISKNVHWHLLFRRNIFIGSPVFYQEQSENNRAIRNTLQIFLNTLKNYHVYFYTDTDDLTEQYNFLGITKFTTLPLPHTYDNSLHKSKTDKIRITYLGDARTEKGYHLLPKICTDLWKYLKNDKIEFYIQSNYNIPEGETKPMVARNQLQLLDSKNIHLLMKPLDIESYQNLLLTSSILLLLYDADNYYARSSGILAEALSAGIPVIVPTRTWMARQFIKQVYLYHLSLLNKLKIIESVSNFKWRKLDKTRIAQHGSFISFRSHDNRIYSEIKIPENSSYMLLKLDFVKRIENRFVGGYIITLDNNDLLISRIPFELERLDDDMPGTFFIPINKNSKKIRIELKNPLTDVIIMVQNLQIIFFDHSEVVPISIIGCIYQDPTDITFYLKELIDNYSHYLQSAKSFSKNYFEFHNAENMIRMMTNQNSGDKN